MKRTIRRGVFETNSSSMHSIVVMKNDVNNQKKDYVYIEADGSLWIWDRDLEFGRSPFDVLATAERKLHYAIASILQNCVKGHVLKDGNCDEFLSGKLDEFDSIAAKLFKGCKRIKYPTVAKHDDKYEWEEPYLGYVDHDGDALLSRFLERENISLYEFISNPKYIVVIDGDEYCVFNTMKQAGVINKENIVKEYCNGSYCYDYVHEEDKKL